MLRWQAIWVRVLVVGAGPGGAAAAIELARGGASVLIAEKSAWPRPKTCGDGISPAGVRETLRLGVDLGDKPHLEIGEISTPGGVVLRSGWREETPWGAIVEREDFDARLIARAIACGATFEPRTLVRELTPARNGREVPRARFSVSGSTRRLRDEPFDAIVLAEGATGGLGSKLGFGRHRSRLVALRGYARPMRPLDPVFGLYFDRGISPGYGWIFPRDDGAANVGVLVDERAGRRAGGLRRMLPEWIARNAIPREALGPDPHLAHLSGGIIPTGRARRFNGGIFAVGDAAGVADPFSAEGIWQALATGSALAAALLAAGIEWRKAERAYSRALRPFDRNAREAHRLRLGFNLVIDPLARRAVTRPRLARHFSANGMFMKESLPAFLWGIVREW
jgi:geranylgeranyl reductase family protein